MASHPTEVQLALTPSRRFDVIDVNRLLDGERSGLLSRYRKALYSSMHTTAGYLDRALAARLVRGGDRVASFFRAFGVVFPQGGPYRHDQMDLREELSEEQKEVEPRNGDSHLTFIGSGMRNCATYSSRPESPVYFIDLDGEFEGTRRRRVTSVLAYDHEELVARTELAVPVSRHPIDSVNLGDRRLGVIEAADDLLARVGIEKGRVDITLDPAERNAGLTVNEYETLLMRHDLAEVLRNPLGFAALKGRHMLDDPLAIPSKTINYAKYDVVRVLNSVMEALGISESLVERLVAKAMSVPARRFLRARRVSFLASDHRAEGQARLVRGTYQSPILVQWQPAERQLRKLQISVVRLS